MPEYSTGNVLLPQLPPSIEEIRERAEALQRQNREREARTDEAFIDAVRFLTGVDLTDLVARGHRAEEEKRVVTIFDVVIVDTVPRVAASSSPDPASGAQPPDGTLVVNQNGQVVGTIGGNQPAQTVSMLPMWRADP